MSDLKHRLLNRKLQRKRQRLTEEQKLALIGRLRIGDLNKLFQHRYHGDIYPDDDDGRHSLMIMPHHYARNNPLKVPSIIKDHAPWMPQDEIDEMLQEIADKPRSWRSKTLGRELNFTGAEWRRLRLRTIAPVDMTKAERDQDTRLRKRQRMRLKRRVEDRTPRAEWLATSKSRTKPWIAAGIGRTKWYELQRRHDGNSDGQVCAHKTRTYDTHLSASHTKPIRRGRAVRQEADQ